MLPQVSSGSQNHCCHQTPQVVYPFFFAGPVFPRKFKSFDRNTLQIQIHHPKIAHNFQLHFGKANITTPRHLAPVPPPIGLWPAAVPFPAACLPPLRSPQHEACRSPRRSPRRSLRRSPRGCRRRSSSARGPHGRSRLGGRSILIFRRFSPGSPRNLTSLYLFIYIYMSPVPGPPHPPQCYPPPLLTPPTPPKPSICMLFAHIHTHIHIYTPLSTPPTSHLYVICST